MVQNFSEIKAVNAGLIQKDIPVLIVAVEKNSRGTCAGSAPKYL
jgi:hypothetical protein